METKIDCNFARAAIHHFTKQKFTRNHKLPKGSISTIIQEYNKHFSGYQLATTYNVAVKKFLPITRIISKDGARQMQRKYFLQSFHQKHGLPLRRLRRPNTHWGCEVCKTQVCTIHTYIPISLPLKSTLHSYHYLQSRRHEDTRKFWGTTTGWIK